MKLPKKILNYLFSTTPAKEVVPFNYDSILKYIHCPSNLYYYERLIIQLKDDTVKVFYYQDKEWFEDATAIFFTFEEIYKRHI
jgi:hypothetical protein